MVTKRIAIIPARGGSKRIPKKNIIDFAGKPMIQWSIEAALLSKMFERVVVSTDDEEIAEVSRRCGAEVPFLRHKYADDYATVSQATLSALEQAEDYWSAGYDTVTQLMANCPLRTASDISHALTTFEQKGRAFQLSCFEFGWMNPWWAATIDQSGRPANLFPDASSQRSQDLPPLYCPTGAIWVASCAALKQAGTFYGPDHYYEPIPWFSAVDIDDRDDLMFALSIKNTIQGNSLSDN